MSGICAAHKTTDPAFTNVPWLDAGRFRSLYLLVLSLDRMNLPQLCYADAAPSVPQIELRGQTSGIPTDFENRGPIKTTHKRNSY